MSEKETKGEENIRTAQGETEREKRIVFALFLFYFEHRKKM